MIYLFFVLWYNISRLRGIMLNLDYKKLYEEAYKNHITDNRLIKIKKYLYKIVRHYYIRVKDIIYEPEEVFFKEVIKCFEKVIEDNSYSNIDENIDFLFVINKLAVNFGSELYTLLFPEDTYERFDEEYFHKFNNFFWQYENIFKRHDNQKESHSRIEEILKCYLKYARTITDDFHNREMHDVASYIGALFYLTDNDISFLDEKFNILFNNYEDISCNFLLNYYDTTKDYKIELASYIINNKLDRPKKLIK